MTKTGIPKRPLGYSDCGNCPGVCGRRTDRGLRLAERCVRSAQGYWLRHLARIAAPSGAAGAPRHGHRRVRGYCRRTTQVVWPTRLGAELAGCRGPPDVEADTAGQSALVDEIGRFNRKS